MGVLVIATCTIAHFEDFLTLRLVYYVAIVAGLLLRMYSRFTQVQNDVHLLLLLQSALPAYAFALLPLFL